MKTKPISPQGVEEESDLTARIWSEFKSALRGRLLWAGLLGGGLGVAAAAAVWITAVPIYKSTAQLRVNSYTEKILRKTETTGVLPHYEKYLGAQAHLIRSHRVADMAMQEGPWLALGRTFTPESQREFRKNLQVNQSPATELIFISFTDPDRDAAGRATESVVDAYLQIHSEQERVSGLGRLRVLENRQTTLTEQLSQVRQDMQRMSAEYGLAGIESEYAGRIEAQTNLKLELLSLTASRPELEAKARQEAESIQAHGEEFLEAANPEAAKLKEKIRLLRQEVSREERKGTLPNHPRMRELQGEIADSEIDLSGITEIQAITLEGLPTPDQDQLESLNSKIEVSRQALEGLGSEIKDLKFIVERLAQLKSTESELRDRIQETASRIETLNLESSQDSRIEVLSKSEIAHAPVNSKNIASKTMTAGFGGVALGFMIVGGLGMLQRELRDSRDVSAAMKHRRLLGMIPVIEEGVEATNSSDVIRSFELLRSAIQLHTDRSGEAVSIAVTGPVSGSGKTTASLLLAQSFAESDTRTLLIDLDAEGRGLSHTIEKYGLPRIGETLARRFGLSSRLIAAALERAKAKGRPLGEYLVYKGIVTEEQRDEALAIIKDEPDGLVGVLRGRSLKRSVCPTRWKRLDALPFRNRSETGFRKVGRQAVASLLSEAKKHYELVIVDTGPTPGSVEGSFAVSAADHTIVVVARGDQRVEMDACDGFLRSIDAPVLGYVMNRCEFEDFARSNMSVSRRSGSSSTSSDLSKIGGLMAHADAAVKASLSDEAS